MTVFTQNLKRLRTARRLTQDQAAEELDVSPQTISRWECGTTMPDLTVLPAIARLYGVTIDDLYRESYVAYKNYAQRLCSVFESSLAPADFLRADEEYKRQLRSGDYTADDLRLYGILHQNMAYVCRNRALELFDQALAQGPDTDPQTFWSTRRQKCYFLFELGRNQEVIDEFLPRVRSGSPELQDWLCLIQAYSFAKDYDSAWHWTNLAAARFPENASLHIYTGDLLRAMKRYTEAFPHWQRARELEPDWLDAAWSMAECYEELGDYLNAAESYQSIVDNLTRRGFTEETHLPRTLANKCREKYTK